MNRTASRAIAALIILAAALPAAAEEYTLESYVRKVAIDNPDLALSSQRVASAAQNKRLAGAALLPTVAGTGNYSRNLEDIMAPAAAYVIDTGATGALPIQYVTVDQNKDNEITYGIAVKFNLLSATDIAKFRQAQMNCSIQDGVNEFTRQSVLTAAKKLYAQVQLAQNVLEVRRLSERNFEEAYRIIERKYNAGSATELDLRLAEVDWKTESSAVADAEKNERVAMMALKTLAGIPADTEITLAGDSEELPAIPGEPELPDVLAARGDYRAQLLGKEIADIAYASSLATFLPTISGTFAAMHGGKGDESRLDDYEYDAVQLQLGVTLPLFTGGSRHALMRLARIQQDQAGIQIRQKQDQIRQDLETLRLRIVTAKSRIETALLLESTVERAASLAQKSMESGLSTQLAASQANTKLASARLNLQNAIYEYRAACYDWELATGMVDRGTPAVAASDAERN